MRLNRRSNAAFRRPTTAGKILRRFGSRETSTPRSGRSRQRPRTGMWDLTLREDQPFAGQASQGVCRQVGFLSSTSTGELASPNTSGAHECKTAARRLTAPFWCDSYCIFERLSGSIRYAPPTARPTATTPRQGSSQWRRFGSSFELRISYHYEPFDLRTLGAFSTG